MWKKSIGIAMSFVGLIVGAGFASGQEMTQYFVSFGKIGVVGAVVASLIMLIAGISTLELGSYFLAGDHSKVFDSVFHPIIAKIVDLAIIFSLFSIGFVMFAGAGANLNQQWNVPTWVGATIMAALVLVSGLLDVEKLSSVIGAVTPVLILIILFIGGYSLVTQLPADTAMLDQAAAQAANPIPHWTIASLNYVGLSLMTAVSMSLVIGGSHLDPKTAGRGGLLGGCFFALLLIVSTVSLYLNADVVATADMPMLALVGSVHPWAGTFMAVVIFIMIYNTAVGMFYALGKRVTASHPRRFFPVFAVTVIIGFGLSFAGFKDLVSLTFPIIGYVGVVLAFLMAWVWLRDRSKISLEALRRIRMVELFKRKHDPSKKYTKKDKAALIKMANASEIDNADLSESVQQEVTDQLVADDSVDFTEDDQKEIMEEVSARADRIRAEQNQDATDSSSPTTGNQE